MENGVSQARQMPAGEPARGNVAATAGDIAGSYAGRSKARFLIVFMLFLVTTVNYADRATLSITGTSIQHALGISPVAMGYIFSSFAWAYVIAQIPGGWLLDRFGSRRVYACSIFFWSVLTALQGFVAALPVGLAIVTLFVLRFLVGAAEAPAFPGNSRLTATWFPTAERGTASAIFNSSQYFAAVLFTPIMGWITHEYGWPHVYFAMGALGVVVTGIWLKTVYAPRQHPLVNEAEVRYIADNGAMVDLEDKQLARQRRAEQKHTENQGSQGRAVLAQLLKSRMMLGVFIAQYCITTLTYFFLTWFPIYLVQERHMSILKAGFVASIPAIAGFLGGVLGGVISDRLMKLGLSTSIARKVPIVVGLLLSTCMIVCNYVDNQWLVVGIMAAAFFGKGIGALGWAVVSDTAPKQASGLCAALFNTFGNTAGITTPIVIGYLVQGTGSFAAALVFVSANALIAIVCYLFVVGKIQRFELKPAA
ncbi:putative glucarate transporter [Paraburkholderia caffeinitolerans]|uniref:Putative glucarate transporter n=1 Tax=Paraburkholderia caffeinitolerans TaxID=1723730 RepID=A0A6J5GNM3_9BURK|nr:MFS transporter [Paraburkholderia caffeinitolerans]CAB3802498.1 putative glucarate transporter [Paraburkholderia caffeinitolerans]